jgi:Cu(I)/Ag(I) efflux system membrane fusion protein
MNKTKTLLTLLLTLAAGFILRGCFTPPSSPSQISNLQPQTTTYTCAMHPQIKLPKPGKCPICFMDLIPLEMDSEPGSDRELTVSRNAARLMDIQTSAVERKWIENSIYLTGKVDYDETRVSYITARIPGRLDRLFVDYTGLPVSKGDHLVELYSPELLTAQEELLQAIQTLKKLQHSENDSLKKSAQNTIDAAREKLRLWGLTSEQVFSIEAEGTPSDHITIYSPVGGIVVHKNAQEGLYVETGTKIYTIADLSKVWILLDAYEADLAWLHYGQSVDFSSEAYPGEIFSGTIAFINPILDQTTRTVTVRVNVDNTEMKLKPGMFIRAAVHANIAASGKVMEPDLAGKWICPMHPEEVHATAGNCSICEMPLVTAESLGYTDIATGHSEPPLVIPATAPLITGKRALVYVALSNREKPTFEGREVVLGPRAGDFYMVKSGLEEGDQVVTRGAFKIDAELQLQAKPNMMSYMGEQQVEPATPEQLETYFKAQTALANDDFEAAKLAMNLNNAPTIETLRIAFNQQSKKFKQQLDQYGAPGKILYQHHCPMAFDNSGAFWFQPDRETLNPYFGESMLHCGSVEAEIQPMEGAHAH